jgi:hypothetical protein
VSIIMEWANTVLNGVSRAHGLLRILREQWAALASRDYPDDLPAEAARFLDSLDGRAELLVVSGQAVPPATEAQIRQLVGGAFDLGIHVGPGLEYYALKNFGADRATGDILLFVDSDVHPNAGWLAHLLGSFARPEIHAVAGQPYVAPTGLFAAAFTLGWTYSLPDDSGRLEPHRKFYANNIALRADTFRRTRFTPLARRTRGAASQLGQELERLGHAVWQNSRARVDHPPPASFPHLAVRALAHGRDVYMKRSEERNLHGFLLSQRVPAERLARGIANTARHWRRVGLRPWQLPGVVAIMTAYYALFALGGLLTHLSPAAMGRRFRV